MMTLHREGTKLIGGTALIVSVLAILTSEFIPWAELQIAILILLFVILFLVVQFFRVPKRKPNLGENKIIAPCDGKVVVIEEIFHKESNEKKIQVSIFMSPINVHVNWYPTDCEVLKSEYKPGKFLVAWDPKSSEENEMHVTTIKTKNNKVIVLKQIAGAVAKRIVNYAKPGAAGKQAGEMGFIKFGSRMDLILPLEAKIKVKIGDKSVGQITEIAEL
jgi:phosphatidylserine decarboxylase